VQHHLLCSFSSADFIYQCGFRAFVLLFILLVLRLILGVIVFSYL